MTMTCLDSLGFKPLSTGNTLAESYPIFTTFYVTSMIDMHRARQIAFGAAQAQCPFESRSLTRRLERSRSGGCSPTVARKRLTGWSETHRSSWIGRVAARLSRARAIRSNGTCTHIASLGKIGLKLGSGDGSFKTNT